MRSQGKVGFSLYIFHFSEWQSFPPFVRDAVPIRLDYQPLFREMSPRSYPEKSLGESRGTERSAEIEPKSRYEKINVLWFTYNSAFDVSCYRPNTGQSPFEEEKADLLHKYNKISLPDAGEHYLNIFNLVKLYLTKLTATS